MMITRKNITIIPYLVGVSVFSYYYINLTEAWSSASSGTRTILGVTSATTTCTNGSLTCRFAPKTALHLVPLTAFTDPSHKTYLSSSDSYRTCIDSKGRLRQNDNDDDDYYYTVSIAEEDDLPSITTLTIDAFGGADVITLSSGLSAIEQSLMTPGVSMWNSYANVVAYTDVLSGLRKRMKHRLDEKKDRSKLKQQGQGGIDNGYDNECLDYMISSPLIGENGGNIQLCQSDVEEIAEKSSVIIALARKPKQQNGNNNVDDQKIDVIATVELRLQPTDAKIPFSQPWFDKLERRLEQIFSKNNQQKQPITLKPYLSNLCVDEKARGRQIGKALCRVVECIARDSWNYNHVYLHVDLENVAALNLYRSEGYNDVGIRWNPFWAGKASEIGYYVKKL